jgi:hypothetical protein
MVGAAVGLLLMVLSGVFLLRSVGRFRRGWRDAEIMRFAAVPQHAFRLEASGDLRLFLEGPKFRTYPKRLSYSLQDAATGMAIPMTPVLAGSGVRSLRRSRVERGRFNLPAPGDLVLQIGGLEAADQLEYEIVFMRPFRTQLLTFILGCVALGMILIGSFVLVILSLVFR